VQRLFSMFPTGVAGAALLLLRASVATTFLVDGSARGVLLTSFWIFMGFALPAACLYLGFLTPYCASLCCLIEVGASLITGGRNEFHFVMSSLDSAVLAMLGPGAYSVDGRIFGRRLLSVSPRMKSR
jgi:hypothetical protein